MGTHRPQPECRRTTPPLTSTSATAPVGPLLAGKVTSCKPAVRQLLPRHRLAALHPVAARLAGPRVRLSQALAYARLASTSRPTEGFMRWAGAPPTWRAATSCTHLNIIRRLTPGLSRQLLSLTTRSTTWLAACSPSEARLKSIV